MDTVLLKAQIAEAKEKARSFSQIAEKAGADERDKWSNKSREWAQHAEQLEALLKGN
jgi:uncharacterized protein (DUF2345 family)